jgi:hypothetical protein
MKLLLTLKIKTNGKAAAEYAKDRGWEFEIWTEHKLEAMGINPKPLKSLKKIAPLKPLRKPKKKK